MYSAFVFSFICTFSLDNSRSSDSSTLTEIDLSIKKGSLTAVVGVVGSGKSSLLSALLGDMRKTEGRAAVAGSLAFVPQQPFIQNMSLRDNILFDREYEEGEYARAVEACALKADLDILQSRYDANRL